MSLCIEKIKSKTNPETVTLHVRMPLLLFVELAPV